MNPFPLNHAKAATVAWLLFQATASAEPVFEYKPPPALAARRPVHRLHFKIRKLSCATCGQGYVATLSRMRGIKYARVELHQPWDAEALVIFDPREVRRKEILDALHRIHYYEGEVKER